MKAKTDEELMELYQHGDQAAFIELYSRYDGPLYGFIYNSLKVMAPALLADADDIQQNIYAWIHQYRGRFVAGSVKPWLFTTADRLLRNHIESETRQQRDVRRTRRLVPTYGDIGEHLSENWMLPKKGELEHENVLAKRKYTVPELVQNKVDHCLGLLPPMHQQVIQLIYIGNYTAQEAADKLGLPKTTVDWYKREALAMMRETRSESASDSERPRSSISATSAAAAC
jgi:RNA polymerase sigma factor (sigma-70 family)